MSEEKKRKNFLDRLLDLGSTQQFALLLLLVIVLLLVVYMTGNQISLQIGPLQIGPRPTEQIAVFPTAPPGPTPVPTTADVATWTPPSASPVPATLEFSSTGYDLSVFDASQSQDSYFGMCGGFMGWKLKYGEPYWDWTYGSGHYMVLYEDLDGNDYVEVGTANWGMEDYIYLSEVPSYWVEAHRFTNVSFGSFQLCADGNSYYANVAL